MSRPFLRILPIAAAVLLAACASDGNTLFQTASVTPPVEEPKPVKTARVDPACVALANQIETIRKDGTIDRLEKVAAGKTDKVQVKRAAIARQAELNKANADFQAKCGPRIPMTQEASAATVAPAAAAPAVKAAAKAAQPAAPGAGVTIVPSQQKPQQ